MQEDRVKGLKHGPYRIKIRRKNWTQIQMSIDPFVRRKCLFGEFSVQYLNTKVLELDEIR